MKRAAAQLGQVPAAPRPAVPQPTPAQPPAAPRPTVAPSAPAPQVVVSPSLSIPNEIAVSLGQNQAIQLQLAVVIPPELQAVLAEKLSPAPKPERGSSGLAIAAILGSMGTGLGALGLLLDPIRSSELGVAAAIGAAAIGLFSSGFVTGAIKRQGRSSGQR
jgi:hypothetical protein